MSEEDFQKERRDWWKEVYVATCVKTNGPGPRLVADKALEQFDAQFKKDCEGYRNLSKVRKREQHDLLKNVEECPSKY